MSGVLKQMTITGTEQPEVAHFDEARREHVLEEATDELFGGHGGVPELISGRFFVGESDVAVLQLAEAVVTDGHAKDVRGEILKGLDTTGNRFGVDHPGFAPEGGRD
ncbi:hypothetical protein BH20ACI3_BH20ACI3_42790 [soil metagenome]